MEIFNHFAKAIYSEVKVSKMADLVDDIEIDNI